jgi:hypothetical protein
LSASGLIRWGGLAAVVGGVLSILFACIGEDSWAHVPLDAARYAFLVVGIVGNLSLPAALGALRAVGNSRLLRMRLRVRVGRHPRLGHHCKRRGRANIYRPRPGAWPSAAAGLAALGRSRTESGKVATPRSMAAHRRCANERAGHTRHDCLWRHARCLGVHHTHGALRAGMGVAGVRPLVRKRGRN